jgi:hypothetical protein
MSITITDGVAVINAESIPEAEVDVEDREALGSPWRVRRFRIPCGDGWRLSVVFGSGTYSDNRDYGYGGGEWRDAVDRAEVGILSPDGLVDLFGWGDTVKGYCPADEVVDILVAVRAHVAAL